ncbi:MAG: response regulator [Proteobacteria bacterium]|nr:response regulator [Pseudomonadota bacterium]
MTEVEEKTAPKIMIVDDEVIVAEDLRGRLISLGYKVTAVVGTGKEAIAMAEETNPDLILMDIQLKGDMDGIEAAGVIKKRFDISVVYLTAYSDQETLDRAKVTTPFGYLIKPFAERELHSTIEMALYKQDMDREMKILRGMLPICADCKSIRDDKGYWNQLEEYMRKHTDIEFTHGLCPVCAEKLLEDAKREF